MKSWKAHFDLGVTQFREKNFEDAVSHFTEAILKDGNRHIIYDSRSAALEKLDRIQDALKDARKVIELTPDSPQGYKRCARLFSKAGRYEAAVKMASFVLARVPQSDTAQMAKAVEFSEELKELRDASLAHAKETRCHIGQLPSELISNIIQLAGQDQYTFPVVASHICRHWRMVALDTCSLWRILVLNGHNDERKIQTWIERSSKALITRGIIHLTITKNVPGRLYIPLLNVWYEAPIHHSTLCPPYSLRLSPGSGIATRFVAGWLKGHPLPRSLRSIEISPSVADPYIIDALIPATGVDYGYPPSFQIHPHYPTPIEHLALQNVFLTESICWINFTTLKTLSFKGIGSTTAVPGPMLEVLRSNLDLEEFRMEYTHVKGMGLEDTQDGTSVLLPALKTLELGGNLEWCNTLPNLTAPTLDILILSHGRGIPTEYIGTTTGLGRQCALTELRLRSCAFDLVSLLRVLESAPNICTLEISKTTGEVNNMVYALAGLDPAKRRPTGVMLCPRLRYLDLTRCSRLKGGPIRDLVKMRILALESSPLQGDAPTALQKIVIDGCPGIEPDILPWIRTKVAVSCVYQTKEEAKAGKNLRKLHM